MSRVRIIDTPAQAEGEDRLIAARGSIREAFDGLDLSFDFDDVIEYLEGTPIFDTFGGRKGIVAGLVMGFAIVAVADARAGR